MFKRNVWLSILVMLLPVTSFSDISSVFTSCNITSVEYLGVQDGLDQYRVTTQLHVVSQQEVMLEMYYQVDDDMDVSNGILQMDGLREHFMYPETPIDDIITEIRTYSFPQGTTHYITTYAFEQMSFSEISSATVPMSPPPVVIPNVKPEVRVTNNGDIDYYANGQIIQSFSFKSELGDLDNDGDLDVLVGSVEIPSMVLKNDGTGHFSVFQTLDSFPYTYSVALGDLDGDHDLDGVLADQYNGTKILQNDGSGFFTEGQVLLTRESDTTITSVLIADFNNDNYPDICLYLTIPYEPSVLKILYNDGAGNFTSDAIVNLPYSVDVYGLQAADFDANGYTDLVVGAIQGVAHIVFNSSSGMSVSDQILSIPEFNDMQFESHPGDLDGDGDKDILIDYIGPPSAIWFNDGHGAFTLGSQMIGTENGNSASDLGDLDNDGDLDIYIAGLGGANEVWLNDGHGTFSLSAITTTPAFGAFTVRLADLDRDADLDVFANLFYFGFQNLILFNTPTITLNEGAIATATGTANDADSDPLTVTADFGNLTDNQDGTWYWNAVTTDDTIQTVMVSSTDGQLTGVSNFTLVVQNVAPTITDVGIPATVREAVPLSLNVLYTDPGTNDTHEIIVDWGDSSIDTIPGANGLAQFSKTYATAGTYTVTITVTDDDSGTVTQTRTVEVLPPNQAPVIATDNTTVTVVEGSPAINTGTVADADGDVLTLTASIGSVVNNGDGTWSWNYTAVDNGNQTVTITADDGATAPVSTSFDFTATNAAPVISSISIPQEVFINQPVNVTVNFTDAGSADNHDVTIEWTDSDAFSEIDAVSPTQLAYTFTAPGSYTIYIGVNDYDNGRANTSRVIEVLEPNHPPVINVSTTAVTVTEGILAVNTGTIADADGDVLTLTASIGSVVNNGDGTWSWSYTPADNSNQTVTITANDGTAAPVSTSFNLTATNAAPVIASVTAPIAPINISAQPVSVVTTFTDVAADNHTVSIAWGDNNTSTINNAVSPSSASHTYTEAGVYPVIVTVTDDDGASTSYLHEYIVIFNPDGGFVTGGGWITSPAGAYSANTTLTGKANFGFVSKYHHGASVPSGNTEFNFKAGPLNFKSTSYEWLVITANQTSANYKGSGTINGNLAPNGLGYNFKIWAKDLSTDTFRIKIWYETSGVETVVYDNGTDQAIGGGNVQIHQ